MAHVIARPDKLIAVLHWNNSLDSDREKKTQQTSPYCQPKQWHLFIWTQVKASAQEKGQSFYGIIFF